jgi:hypothetical protein
MAGIYVPPDNSFEKGQQIGKNFVAAFSSMQGISNQKLNMLLSEKRHKASAKRMAEQDTIANTLAEKRLQLSIESGQRASRSEVREIQKETEASLLRHLDRRKKLLDLEDVHTDRQRKKRQDEIAEIELKIKQDSATLGQLKAHQDWVDWKFRVSQQGVTAQTASQSLTNMKQQNKIAAFNLLQNQRKAQMGIIDSNITDWQGGVSALDATVEAIYKNNKSGGKISDKGIHDLSEILIARNSLIAKIGTASVEKEDLRQQFSGGPAMDPTVKKASIKELVNGLQTEELNADKTRAYTDLGKSVAKNFIPKGNFSGTFWSTISGGTDEQIIKMLDTQQDNLIDKGELQENVMYNSLLKNRNAYQAFLMTTARLHYDGDSDKAEEALQTAIKGNFEAVGSATFPTFFNQEEEK